MKITVNKEFTLASQMQMAKEKAKEFKRMYTDSDLRNALERETNYDLFGAIIRCDVYAFPEKDWGNEMGYMVEMVLEESVFKRVNFYVDHNLKVRTNLITYKVFK